MKQIVMTIALWALMAAAGQAECFVGYKAKQDDPLRLHYGIMHVTDAPLCADAALLEGHIANRLGDAGWTLLHIVEVQQTPPTDEQREVAGDYFQRF